MFTRPPSRFARLRLERLEDRAVPAVVNWTRPGDGEYDNPNNWTVVGTNPADHRVPGSADDAVIPAQYSVTSSHNATVRSLSATNFQVLDGTFTITQPFVTTAGTTRVHGGATLRATVRLDGGALD